ncbi:MAG: carbohydrate porin [Gammaproteobacteria bacterium]|nr:carbohydrate porin [Gammaproteobacteria bacterium]
MMSKHEQPICGAIRSTAAPARPPRTWLGLVLTALCVTPVWAAPDTLANDAAVTEAGFAIHGQATLVEQATAGFRAPYAGRNSLSPRIGRETFDATLFFGWRISGTSQFWISPEIDQGFGLDDTLGAAGFPSGEAYKVGQRTPYLRLPRAFVRSVWNLGGPERRLGADAMELGESVTRDRIVLTVGKFSVTDLFDANRFAHDPRADFLNWGAIDAATFDYAADAWGYTVGGALEWYQGPWTLRGGLFDLSDVPNSARLEPGFHEYQTILEMERRYRLGMRPGTLRLTGYDSHARMALLDAAVAAAAGSGAAPDPASVRAYRDRTGLSVSMDQSIGDSLGLFARAGRGSGNVEAYEFTDVDRTLTLGFSANGAAWHRAGDTWALAAISNGISAARERYLAAGGLGILIGDGRLPHPGPERIVETYYQAALGRHAAVSLDLQQIWNPGYNRDRGPAAVAALRVHAQF